jgi:hypothetical protein
MYKASQWAHTCLSVRCAWKTSFIVCIAGCSCRVFSIKFANCVRSVFFVSCRVFKTFQLIETAIARMAVFLASDVKTKIVKCTCNFQSGKLSKVHVYSPPRSLHWAQLFVVPCLQQTNNYNWCKLGESFLATARIAFNLRRMLGRLVRPNFAFCAVVI